VSVLSDLITNAAMQGKTLHFAQLASAARNDSELASAVNSCHDQGIEVHNVPYYVVSESRREQLQRARRTYRREK
jgi:hypothetical protein